MTPTTLEPLTHDRPMSIRRPRTRVLRAGLDRRGVLAANALSVVRVGANQLVLFDKGEA